MYFVYILESITNKNRYIGVSNNLKRRLQEHNRGEVRYTSSKRPYKLIWYCVFNSKKQAFDFEKYLKSASGIAFSRKRLIPCQTRFL